MSTILSATQIVALLASQKQCEAASESAQAILTNFVEMARACEAADDTPVVWVEMDNGRVNRVVADRPCRLVVTETDLEGADEDDVFIEQGKVELFLYQSFRVAEIDPEAVTALREQADAATS